MTRDFVRALVAGLGVAALTSGAWSVAADAPKAEPKAAYERLKTLAGEWNVVMGEDGPPMKIVYRVISNGSTVMETFFPGTDHEMVSMYHLDGDVLRMTHYCAAGNQPRTKLDLAASTPDSLVFAFDGGSNLDPAKDMHMHGGKIVFKDKDHVDAVWDGYAGGEKQQSTTFKMNRP